jgi:LuxR family maltose regulon positive regulatory protein
VTAGTPKPSRPRRQRRIIERPRLIKMLDEADARVILLLAPAGYGKTTLARQWAKTLNGAIWIGLTPAHRDVATLAEDIAEALGGPDTPATDYIRQFVKARVNPQIASHEIARALAAHLKESRVQWLVIDDLHELSAAHEVASIIETIHEETECRLLITSRTRPAWMTARLLVYGDIAELDRNDLAMDADESRLVVGQRPGLGDLVERAKGWPAVIAMAANSTRLPASVGEGILSTSLYQYFAEELFSTADDELQAQLLTLAVVPETAGDESAGIQQQQFIRRAAELGFLSLQQPHDLHPLLREFLLEKFSEKPDSQETASEAVRACLASERWERAIELIERFGLNHMVEEALKASYHPLIRSGRFGTLASFGVWARRTSELQPIVLELIDAEVALAEGSFELALSLAQRAVDELKGEHRLFSRACWIIGQAAFARGDPERAEIGYRQAYESAVEDQDRADAAYGWALAAIQGESNTGSAAIERLASIRSRSPVDLLRYTTAEVVRTRFNEGFSSPLAIQEGLRAISHARDPRARSSLLFTATYVLALQAEYEHARELAIQVREEIQSFGLDFARPLSEWNDAFISVGLRKFGQAERALQRVEDAAMRTRLGYHVLNARVLRARLALATGDIDSALAAVRMRDREVAIPSLHGEYLATRALVLAVHGDRNDARSSAAAATAMTTAVEVRVLAQATQAILEQDNPEEGDRLIELATSLNVWDPVVAALRACPPLSDFLASRQETRDALEALYLRTRDVTLQRRAGFRTRSMQRPADILSPRELEVLGLIARGFRNREIARALVIAESTTKVHVRHILEKLGVRTRSEAVARYEMFRD